MVRTGSFRPRTRPAPSPFRRSSTWGRSQQEEVSVSQDSALQPWGTAAQNAPIARCRRGKRQLDEVPSSPFPAKCLAAIPARKAFVCRNPANLSLRMAAKVGWRSFARGERQPAPIERGRTSAKAGDAAKVAARVVAAAAAFFSMLHGRALRRAVSFWSPKTQRKAQDERGCARDAWQMGDALERSLAHSLFAACGQRAARGTGEDPALPLSQLGQPGRDAPAVAAARVAFFATAIERDAAGESASVVHRQSILTTFFV